MEEEYPAEVKMFSPQCIVDFTEAAGTLLCKEDMPADLVTTIAPSHAPLTMQTVSFLVDLWALKEPKSIYLDDHGNWGPFWSASAYYVYCGEESAQRVDQQGMIREKLLPSEYDVKLVKSRYRHPNSRGRLSKYIFVARDKEERLHRWAIISYRWTDTPFEFGPLPRTQEHLNWLDSLELSGREDPEEMMESFPDGVKLFSKKCIGEFKSAADILLLTEEAGEDVVCTRVPPRAPMQMSEAAFLVDLRQLKNPRQVFVDSHGHWGKSSGLHAYYRYAGNSVIRVDSDGKLTEFSGDWDVKMLKVRYRHVDTKGQLMKHIFTARDREGQLLRWALVCYKWHKTLPYEFTPSRARGGTFEQMLVQEEEETKKKRRVIEPDAYESRLKELRGDLGEHPAEPTVPRDLWPEEEGEFAEGVSLFGAKAITDFRDCTDILFKLDKNTVPTCTIVPQGASLQRAETSFIVDLKGLDVPEQVFQDSHGSWGKPHGGSVFYKCTKDSIERLGTDGSVEYSAKVTKGRYKHPNAGGKLCKYVFTCRSAKGRMYRWALVSYKWDDIPFPFQPGPPYRGTHFPRLDRSRVSIKSGEDDGWRLVDSLLCESVEELIGDKAEVKEKPPESDIIDPDETFPPGVVPFSPKLVSNFAEAAEVMIRKAAMGPVCVAVPPSAPLNMRTITYLVDLQELADPRDVFVDLHGVWGKCSSTAAYYRYNTWGVAKVDTEGRMKGPDQSYDVKMQKLRYKHTRTQEKLKKFIFTAQNFEEEYLRWALVCYQWDCEPYIFQAAPHGNSRKNVPYQPTKPSARNRLKELSLLYTPQRAISEYLMEKGEELEQAEPHEMPRDTRQAANLGRFPRSIHRAADKIAKNAKTAIRQFPTRDFIYAVLDETLGDSVFSYTVTRQGEGDYSCICEEFRTCFMCRHSLAVAKVNEECDIFIDSVAEKMRDPAAFEELQGPYLTSGLLPKKKRGRPRKQRLWEEETDIPSTSSSYLSASPHDSDNPSFSNSKVKTPGPKRFQTISSSAVTIVESPESSPAKGKWRRKGSWRRKEVKEEEEESPVRKSPRITRAKRSLE